MLDKDRRGEGEKTLDHLIKPNGLFSPPDYCWAAFMWFFTAKKRAFAGWVEVSERNTHTKKEREGEREHVKEVKEFVNSKNPPRFDPSHLKKQKSNRARSSMWI